MKQIVDLLTSWSRYVTFVYEISNDNRYNEKLMYILVLSSDIFLCASTNAKGLPNIKQSVTSKSNFMWLGCSLVDDDLLLGEGATR